MPTIYVIMCAEVLDTQPLYATEDKAEAIGLCAKWAKQLDPNCLARDEFSYFHQPVQCADKAFISISEVGETYLANVEEQIEIVLRVRNWGKS